MFYDREGTIASIKAQIKYVSPEDRIQLVKDLLGFTQLALALVFEHTDGNLAVQLSYHHPALSPTVLALVDSAPTTHRYPEYTSATALDKTTDNGSIAVHVYVDNDKLDEVRSVKVNVFYLAGNTLQVVPSLKTLELPFGFDVDDYEAVAAELAKHTEIPILKIQSVVVINDK
jgi:hypothetical protein